MYDKNREIIEGRYDSIGRKTYWSQGYKGKGIKVAVIDDFNNIHGHQMASVKEYIAPECELIKLDMRGNYWDIIDRINECSSLGVNIISISRGVDFTTAGMEEAVKSAKSKGILIFASAGNDGDKFADSVDIKNYPAYYPEVISVMSVENNYTVSEWASHNTMADITFFGQNLLVKSSNGEEMLVDGTSAPTAVCAFATALHWQMYVDKHKKQPTWDYISNFVKTNVIDLNEVGKDNFTGYGFYTLDKTEWMRVKLLMLDINKDGLEERVNMVKSLMKSGVSYEEAEKKSASAYYLIGYEMINGAKVPMYGGKKQTY